MCKTFGAFFTIFLLLGMANDAFAQSRYHQRQFQPFLTRGETTWSVKAGLKRDDFEYNQASDLTGNATPDVAVEEYYHDVNIFEIEGNVRHVEPINIGFIKGGVMVEGAISGGVIFDGINQYSIYSGDSRTNETFREYVDNMSGDTIGASVALGYKINLTGTPAYRARKILDSRLPKTRSDRIKRELAMQRALKKAGPYISVTPLIGYAWDQQTYHLKDGYDLIPTLQPHPLDFDYVANWYGPFVGIEGEIKNKKHMLRLRGQYHDMTYFGKAVDHAVEPGDTLAGDPSWDDEADATGILLGAEYSYALGDDYALTLDATYKNRESDKGKSNIYYQDGTVDTVQLNEAVNESKAVRVGVRYNWD